MKALAAFAARLAGDRATVEWQRARRRWIRSRLAAGLTVAEVQREIEAQLAPPGRAAPAEAPTGSPPDPEAELLWDAVLRALEPEVPPHVYATWLRPTRGQRFTRELESATLVVSVPSAQHASWLPATWSGPILQTARAIRPGLEVRLVHEGPDAGDGVLLHSPEAA